MYCIHDPFFAFVNWQLCCGGIIWSNAKPYYSCEMCDMSLYNLIGCLVLLVMLSAHSHTGWCLIGGDMG